MHTTVDLDEDVLRAIKEIAKRRGVSIGKTLSDMVRQALSRQVGEATRNGAPLFPVQPETRVVTMEIVNQLRDEAP